MSQDLTAWMVNAFESNVKLAPMIGKTSDGNLAVFPYHHRDTDDQVQYPHITIARFGSKGINSALEASTHFPTLMDNPRMAVCVWSRNGVDECWDIYKICDALLRGINALTIASPTFSFYQISRDSIRDDLFDDQQKAFHLHSEYSGWLQLAQAPTP